MGITDHKTCENQLRQAKRPGSNKLVLGPRFKLHSSLLCAGGGFNEDTCSGDGGSPLVCPAKGRDSGDERYFQASINMKIYNVQTRHHNIIFVLT